MEVLMTSSASALKELIGISLVLPGRQQHNRFLLPRRQSPSSLLPRNAASTSPHQEVTDDPGWNGNGAEETSKYPLKLEPARKQLQKRRRSQWSKGDSPGEYGGPPVSMIFQPSWGGNPVVDPLNGSGDYIWKKNWQPFVEVSPSEAVETQVAPNEESDSGFLSLSRAIRLDSLEVDLSEELMKPSNAMLQRQEEVASGQDAVAVQKAQVGSSSPRWSRVPTRREEQMWAKARKAATGGWEGLAREDGRAQIDPVVAAERQRQWYLELKRNLLFSTLGIGALGTACAYLMYSLEIAVSYGAGLIGALAYIRMLGTSVDGMGASGAGAARQALGTPRLLIPVVLVMICNRWNGLLVPEYGVMPLDVIPVFLGFFTYKAATLVETFKELLPMNAALTAQNASLTAPSTQHQRTRKDDRPLHATQPPRAQHDRSRCVAEPHAIRAAAGSLISEKTWIEQLLPDWIQTFVWLVEQD